MPTPSPAAAETHGTTPAAVEITWGDGLDVNVRVAVWDGVTLEVEVDDGVKVGVTVDNGLGEFEGDAPAEKVVVVVSVFVGDTEGVCVTDDVAEDEAVFVAVIVCDGVTVRDEEND